MATQLRCPGCGGLNPQEAPVCDWCGRSFIAPSTSVYRRRLITGGTAAFALLVVAVVSAAILSATRASPRPSPTPTSTPVISVANDVTPVPTTRPVSPKSTETPVPTPPPEYVEIANTGGIGAYVRSTPSARAPGIRAWREGVVLQVIGPDREEEGRVWRHVQDPAGNQGWTPAEYLAPARITPTPAMP